MTGDGRVKVAFVSLGERAEPWLSDVILATEKIAEVVVVDMNGSLAQQFANVSVVVDQGGHASRKVIDSAAEAGVTLWQVLGTGLDHTEVDYIRSKGIALANTPGRFSATAVAEHALLLMLAIAKNLPEAEVGLRAQIMNLPIADELAGRTLGIIGLGASGRALATRARALEMRIISIDVVVPAPEVLAATGIEWCRDRQCLAQLLREADYVSVHVPLTAETRGILNAEALSLMKPGAAVINVARGAVVDARAVVDAVLAGKLKGAGIDVFEPEPPEPDDPLLTCPRIIVTPHIAGVSSGTSRRRAMACAENIQRVADGLAPLFQVQSSKWAPER